jgi:hypothetical protein
MTTQHVHPIAEVLDELMARYAARGLLAEGPPAARKSSQNDAAAAYAPPANWLAGAPPAAMSPCLARR